DHMVRVVEKAKPDHKILGINYGENKETPAVKAGDYYTLLYRKLARLADYIFIYVSSPNNTRLRDLQSEEGLRLILEAMASERKQLVQHLFIKVAPDLALEGLNAVVKIALEYQVTGLIATNTTHIPSYGAGGVSGGPLKIKAREVR